MASCPEVMPRVRPAAGRVTVRVKGPMNVAGNVCTKPSDQVMLNGGRPPGILAMTLTPVPTGRQEAEVLGSSDRAMAGGSSNCTMFDETGPHVASLKRSEIAPPSLTGRESWRALVLNGTPSHHVPLNGGVPL